MRTKVLKLIAVLLLGLAVYACAKQPPLQLPDPIVGDDSKSGWKNY